MRRWPSVPASVDGLDDAVVEAGLVGELEAVDDGLGAASRSWVGASAVSTSASKVTMPT